MAVEDMKDSLRAGLIQARAAVSMTTWERQDAARTLAVLESLPEGMQMVACYVSLPEEPGTTQLIDALRETGIQVLLPVLHGYPDWALFSGWEHTVPAWRGILQPDTEQLGVEALRRADLVIAPALSVARDGTRLGTGGGWYDRALPHRRTNAPVWSLIRSAELRDQLPRMPHDVPVDAVITERGFHQLR